MLKIVLVFLINLADLSLLLYCRRWRVLGGKVWHFFNLVDADIASLLLQSAIGQGMTRKDHSEVSNQVRVFQSISCLASLLGCRNCRLKARAYF
jgi:hypothetical protein